MKRAKRTQDFDGRVCDYCGKTREVVRFFIGAQPLRTRDGELTAPQDWTLHEGTGKLSCDDITCHVKAEAEAKAAIDRHCASMGYKGGAV